MSDWYVILPEGCDWLAVLVDDSDKVTALVDAANAETHIAAGDRYGDVCEAIQAGETAEDVTEADVARVLAAVETWMDLRYDAEDVVVERVLIH